MLSIDETRRRFMAHFAGLGLGASLLPGVLWAEMQQTGAQTIDAEILKSSLALAGLSFTDDERKAMLQNVNRSLTQYQDLHKTHIPNNVSPPFHFSALVPGMKVNRTREPFRMSVVTGIKRPAKLED